LHIAKARDAAQRERERGEQNAYDSDMSFAQHKWDEGDLGAALSRLEAHLPRTGETDRRGFEWYYYWNLCKGDQHLTLTNHYQAVTSVAFSPDGKRLATGSVGNPVQVWDTPTGKIVSTLPEQNVVSLAFAPKGQKLGVGGRDQVVVWNLETFSDAKTGAVIASKAHAYARSFIKLAFSPNGKVLATAGMLAELDDPAPKIWDTATAELVAMPKGHTDLVLDVAFTPDGKTLLSCGVDDLIKFWDTTTWKEIPPSLGQKEYVNALALSPDGRRLATACSHGTMRLWNVATRREVASLDLGLYGFCITLSPDGQTLAAQDGAGLLRLWRAPSTDQ
jgi:WD40 repeat protein